MPLAQEEKCLAIRGLLHRHSARRGSYRPNGQNLPGSEVRELDVLAAKRHGVAGDDVEVAG